MRIANSRKDILIPNETQMTFLLKSVSKNIAFLSNPIKKNKNRRHKRRNNLWSDEWLVASKNLYPSPQAFVIGSVQSD